MMAVTLANQNSTDSQMAGSMVAMMAGLMVIQKVARKEEKRAGLMDEHLVM